MHTYYMFIRSQTYDRTIIYHHRKYIVNIIMRLRVHVCDLHAYVHIDLVSKS